MNELELTIADEDFPALYRSASQNSMVAQRRFLRCIVAYLLLSIIAAAITLYKYNNFYLQLASATIYLTSIFMTLLLIIRKYDESWYKGRALAESIKTISWRYMMGAEPYIHDMNLNDSRVIFINDIRIIFDQNRDHGEYIGIDHCISDAIPQKMSTVRSLPLPTRYKIYCEQRIRKQREWYYDKAKCNEQYAVISFWLMIALQGCALIFMLFNIKYTDLKLPTGIFIIAATSVLTWMQVKKYKDLSTAYSITAHEISFIEASQTATITEVQFSNFVKDAENAFSREHTQWAARRDKI